MSWFPKHLYSAAAYALENASNQSASGFRSTKDYRHAKTRRKIARASRRANR